MSLFRRLLGQEKPPSAFALDIIEFLENKIIFTRTRAAEILQKQIRAGKMNADEASNRLTRLEDDLKTILHELIQEWSRAASSTISGQMGLVLAQSEQSNFETRVHAVFDVMKRYNVPCYPILLKFKMADKVGEVYMKHVDSIFKFLIE